MRYCPAVKIEKKITLLWTDFDNFMNWIQPFFQLVLLYFYPKQNTLPFNFLQTKLAQVLKYLLNNDSVIVTL